jgi:hypothetical protein
VGHCGLVGANSRAGATHTHTHTHTHTRTHTHTHLAQEVAAARCHAQAQRVDKAQAAIQVLLVQPALVVHQHHVANLPRPPRVGVHVVGFEAGWRRQQAGTHTRATRHRRHTRAPVHPARTQTHTPRRQGARARLHAPAAALSAGCCPRAPACSGPAPPLRRRRRRRRGLPRRLPPRRPCGRRGQTTRARRWLGPATRRRWCPGSGRWCA